MTDKYDVVIIGGGIIGSCIGAHLANENLNVAIVNSLNLGRPASLAAAGLLTPYQHDEIENVKLKDFCLNSLDYFKTFYEQIKQNSKVELGFKQDGSLYLIFSNSEIGKKEAEVRQNKNHANITFLNKNEVLKQEPLISSDIVGAYSYPSEGLINNIKFLKAIFEFNIGRKINIIPDKVVDLNILNNQIESILLSNNEKLYAKIYVLCNGVWANNFLKKILGVQKDIITSIKGEIIEIKEENNKTINKILFCEEGYILPRKATNSFEKSSILIGSTSEEINLESHENIFNNTSNGIQKLCNLLSKVLPSYKKSLILNMCSGLRPKTIDSMPILGFSQEIDNLLFAVGHYRNGILMGPLTGKAIKELIVSKNTEIDISTFEISRFSKNHLIYTN